MQQPDTGLLKDLYSPQLRRAVDALFNSQAVCSPKLRQMVEAHAARLSGGARSAPEIPSDLVSYVEKLTRNAYKITDQDIRQLIEAGYSEDAIFEITLCGSMGAGLARLERGLVALKEVGHAPPNP